MKVGTFTASCLDLFMHIRYTYGKSVVGKTKTKICLQARSWGIGHNLHSMCQENTMKVRDMFSGINKEYHIFGDNFNFS